MFDRVYEWATTLSPKLSKGLNKWYKRRGMEKTLGLVEVTLAILGKHPGKRKLPEDFLLHGDRFVNKCRCCGAGREVYHEDP